LFDDEAPEGMSDEDIRCLDGGGIKTAAEFCDELVESARFRKTGAPAKAGAVVTGYAGESGYAVLDRLPTERGARDAGFQDDVRAFGSARPEV
jgi:hypothetical protein